MQLTDEKISEEEINEYYLMIKDQFGKNQLLFNDVHSDIIELFDSIDSDICFGILNKLEEFTNIFQLIDNVLSSFKIMINKYLKYNDKNQKKKLQILQLKNEIDNLKQELINNFSEIDKKENEFNALQSDYIKALKKLDSFNSNNSIEVSIDNLSSTRSNSNEEKIKKQSTKHNLLMNENHELKITNEMLNNNISILKNNIEELKFENNNLKDKLVLANEENVNNKQKIQFSKSKEEIIKNENIKLKTAIQSLKDENETLYNENTYLKSEVSHLSKKEQSSKKLNQYTFDINSDKQKKARNKNEDEEKEKEDKNAINLNSIVFTNEKEDDNKKKEKTNSFGKIFITPKCVVSSMTKDFKKLTGSKLRLTKLENNNDRSHSYLGNDSSRNDNPSDSNYFMYDYFF